jgi:hypothetical protein
MKRPRLHNPPIKTPERTWAKDNQQKAEAFANYLEQTFQPSENQDEPQLLEQVGEEMDIAFVTPKEVAKEIKTNINPKKDPGISHNWGNTEKPSKESDYKTYTLDKCSLPSEARARCFEDGQSNNDLQTGQTSK